MQLRPATLDDLALLQHWDTQPHVAESGGEDDWFDWPAELAHDPEWREQLIAELDGRPIGIVQIIDPQLEETHYWGEIEADLRAIDIWIGEPADLGRGYGTEMMRLALARCFADAKVKAVLVDPLAVRERAHRFYRRAGFEPIERRVFQCEECLVHRLDRGRWESLQATAAPS